MWVIHKSKYNRHFGKLKVIPIISHPSRKLMQQLSLPSTALSNIPSLLDYSYHTKYRTKKCFKAHSQLYTPNVHSSSFTIKLKSVVYTHCLHISHFLLNPYQPSFSSHLSTNLPLFKVTNVFHIAKHNNRFSDFLLFYLWAELTQTIIPSLKYTALKIPNSTGFNLIRLAQK